MVGTLSGKPGGGVIVFTGGRRKGEASGVFVDSQAHDGGFFRGDGKLPFFRMNVNHQCRVGADFANDFHVGRGHHP